MKTVDSAATIRATPLPDVEREVLEACQEATLRRGELVPLLATELGVSQEEVFYTWALRRCEQRGQLGDTPWRYFFHGLECDLRHETDGRFLRIDFGPGGRIDTFTAWGVLQYIMTATAPWREFPRLRELFAQHGPPYDQNSGSLSRLLPIWDRLEAQRVFAQADPALVEFQARHTEVREGGMRFTRLPLDTPEKVHVDCSVAHRTIISGYGHSLLRTPTNGV